jgi:uncharacterized DUF497 family protein
MAPVWDEAKRAANFRKHGVDFANVDGFGWESADIATDQRRDYGETRCLATGMIGDRLHVLVFTVRDEDVRLISLRKANGREVRRYEKKHKRTSG